MNEAELLFSHLLGCSRTELYLDPKKRREPAVYRAASAVLRRRLLGQPLQYILGKTEFMGLDFGVSPDVLIPRPETEILVEACLGLVKTIPKARILDLCTGSGCIAIALAKLCPQALLEGSDVSARALAVAGKNALLNGVKVKFIRSDLFKAPQLQIKRYNLIVSNPPYIRSSEIPKLSPELSFEPRNSLDGGPDGLDFYRRIIPEAGRYLAPGGYLALEIGYGQAIKVKNILLKSKFFAIIDNIDDYNGIPRVIIAKKKVEHG